MPSQTSNLTTLLTELAASGVEFVLVGGLAAVAQGAPVTTFDVGIVHARTPENIDRLLSFLSDVNARYRGRPGGDPLPASRAALEGPGHSLFMTDLGPLDVLDAIDDGLAFDALLPDCVAVALAGHEIRVLSLAAIVRNKRKSTHPKDRHALPVLEETLRQISEREDANPDDES